MKKGSIFYSIFKFKCPHCHEGEFFISRNPYNIKSMSITHKRCPKCNERLSLEPGFYYGAMYVSYGLACGHAIAFWLITYIFNLEFAFWNFIILVGISLLLISPLYYALSKLIWANMFFQYKFKEDEKY